jgi:hypothetical protein
VEAVLWNGTCQKCYRVIKGYPVSHHHGQRILIRPEYLPDWILEIRHQTNQAGLDHYMERRRARGVPEEGLWNLEDAQR